MPVVIPPQHYIRVLDCVRHEPRDVADLLAPAEPGRFEAIPVCDKVNKVANTSPELQEPVEPKPMVESGRLGKQAEQLRLL